VTQDDLVHRFRLGMFALPLSLATCGRLPGDGKSSTHYRW
jgi:hypothetical protein